MYMISVIVPVYNVEKYIEDCLESILNQTYTNFELILVNDGSKDKSGQICDDYSQKHDSVIVIHKENGGQNSAIKTGLKKAKGEYIAFVDSDDWLEPNALELLYNSIKSSNADLVVSNAYRNSEKEEDFLLHYCDEGEYDKQQIEQKIFPNLIVRMTQENVTVAPSRCGKLFKKDLIMQVLHYCDDHIRRGEDKLLTYPYIIKCEKIAVISAKTYHYRDNIESVSYTFHPNRMEEQKRLMSLLNDAVCELTDYDFTSQIEAMSIEAIDMTISESRYQISKIDRKKIYKTFKKTIKDDVVSSKYHPFARRFLERIKFWLIMNRCVNLLWIYSVIWVLIAKKKQKHSRG